MKKQTVIWTALPNGFVAPTPDGGRRLRLSVMVSPRLMTNEGAKPTLSQFPDFLNWPNQQIAFSVKFAGGPTLAADIVSPAPSPDLWQALFKPDSYVRPYAFPQLDDRRIRSFPAMHVMNFLKQQYTMLAGNKPDDLPPTELLTSSRVSFGQIGTYRNGLGNPNHEEQDPEDLLKQRLEETLTKTQALPPSQTPVPLMDFYQAKVFHARSKDAQRVPIDLPELDFHQVVSALGDYPVLLRKLGLVFDLEMPYSADIPGTGVVQVIPSWAPALGATTNTLPATHYMCDGSVRFLAAPRPSDPELKNGMLDLTDGDGYGIIQVDVDGAALKAIDLANNLMRARYYSSIDTPQRSGVPAMRSGGLSLVRTGRAFRLVQALRLNKQRNTQAEGGADPELYAEDVTRGYRVDIWDSRSEVWRSLNRRQGVYKFVETNTLVSAEDEGTVSMGVTQAADGSSPDLYLHESMLTWQGWSLSAPRPGRLIDNEDTVTTVENKAGDDFGLETNFAPVPRSLPRLRFGTSYRMRARAVDLAGNSVPFDSTDDSTASSPLLYGRFEPVSSPVTLLRAPTTSGESVERVVIRSNYNTPSGGPSERHMAPPKSAQLMAEVHGMFDADAGLDKAAYDAIVAREGNFNDSAVHPEDQLALPYLPDPIARGIALRGLPGTAPGAVTQVPFAGAWPDRLPFRVVVEEGTGAPTWDAVDRSLTVRLPKAEMVPVRASSYLNEDDLELMGLWNWLKESGASESQLAGLKTLALKGSHWMLTPFRTLMLVHAVQQPLLAPKYKALQAQKALGNTFATLVDTMPISGKSTDKLDVVAEWDEPVDILSEPKWKTITGNAHAGQLPVSYGDTTASIAMQHEFGDTKYRKVRYSAVATSRYKEYFQQQADETVTLTGTTAVALANTLVVDQSESVKNGDTVCQRDVDYTIDYAAGTITRVDGGQIASGDAVAVSYLYLPGPITRETAAPVAVDVLNSARPAAPNLLYIVPTFAWSKEPVMEGDGSVAIRRMGGGLRIYMDRPWFSSGDGELLGAVLWTPPLKGGFVKFAPKTPPEALKPFVTQWGMDPIWLSNETYAVPALSHFPKAVATAGGLSLAEVPGASVAVAGHQVGYDEQRKLWYCDMEIDAGPSYWPFVRLALARYQPKSVNDAHLSRVMLADFAQLAPDRLATVIFDPDKPRTVAVTVCGPGYKRSVASPRFSSEIEVTVETRVSNAQAQGDFSWVAAANTQPFPLPLTEDDGESFTWAGGVTLPDDRGAQPFRLVIREYERFITDGAFVNPLAIGIAVPTARRLVYAAVLEI